MLTGILEWAFSPTILPWWGVPFGLLFALGLIALALGVDVDLSPDDDDD